MNIFHGLIASFYSKKVYQDVVAHWRGKSYLYLLVLVLILLCPFSVRFMLNTHHLLERILPKVVAQLPVITIKDGVATAQPKGMRVIHYPGMPTKFMVIDIDEQDKNFAQDESLFRVTATGVQWKFKANEVKFSAFKKEGIEVFSPQTINTYLHRYESWFIAGAVVFLYTSGLVFFYIVFLIYALLLGVFTAIIASGFEKTLSYSTNWRLTIVAMTPGAIIMAFLYLFNWLSLTLIVGAVLLQIIYCGFAVWNCRMLLSPEKM